MGRVKVQVPVAEHTDESHWARIVCPMAGKERGAYFCRKWTTRCWWPSSTAMRVSLRAGRPVERQGRAAGRQQRRQKQHAADQIASGHVIRLNDEDGKEKIEIIDKSEKNSIVFDTAKNTITITADKDITLSAAQGTIKLDAQKIEIKSSADAKIEAGAGMDLKASATLNIKGATVNIN